MDYYWISEEMKNEEVIDVHRFDTLSETIDNTTDSAEYHIALVLQDDSGELWWSYIMDGQMTRVFRDSSGHTGPLVPPRYLNEFSASIICT